MGYDGRSKRIKNALKELMAGQQIDGKPVFSAVQDSTHGEFNSYPLLRILPDDITNSQPATGEHDKLQQHIMRVTLPLENNPSSESAVIDQIYDLTDFIVDTIERGDYLGQMSQIDPSVEVLLMTANRGTWTKAQSKTGLIMSCDVTVAITYSLEL